MSRKMTYEVGFTADAKQLQDAVREAAKSLKELSANGNLQITKEMREASSAALDLRNHLKEAYNTETGKLDLINFNNSLSQSGRKLDDYAKMLGSLGPQGEKAFFQVAQAIGKADVPLKRSNQLLNDLWVTMKNTVRWQLTSSTLHGFMGAVQTAFGYTKSLNASLNNISIVTGKSTEQMRAFAEQANQAAKALSTTTTNYTDASLIYYQQGKIREDK